MNSGDDTMPTNHLIVLIGGTSTGKSTVARTLQEVLLPEQWLHFSTDMIFYCLPQSILDAANARNDWSRFDVPLVRRTTLSCLQAVLSAGNRVIYDCVVPTELAAREMVVAFQSYRPLLIALTCSWKEVERRTLARGDRTLEEAKRGFRAADEHLDLDRVIDTTNRDPMGVARDVLAALRDCPIDAWRRNLVRLGTSQPEP